uniref:BHLH domain-containing protein n=1 Tax=Macrostomum lignano TaxID=282301 RepID=A0A1I8ILL9_9PLAT
MKRNDGLVLLYDAAMLLEQHSLGPIGPIPIVNANQSFSSHGIVKRSSKTVEERAHGLTPATASSASTYSPSPTKQRLSATTIRTSHNELEKIRRAKLRISIDQLKSRLPALRGRVTMLTVLKRACAFVKDLEQKSEEQRAQLRQLERRRMELKMRRGQLTRLLRRLKKQAADAAGVSSTYNVSEAAKSFGAKKLRPLTSAMPSVESGDKSSFKAAVASSKQPSSVTGLSWLGSASNAVLTCGTNLAVDTFQPATTARILVPISTSLKKKLLARSYRGLPVDGSVPLKPKPWARQAASARDQAK